MRSSPHVVVRGNRVRRAASFGLVADGTTAPTTTGPVEISRNELLENGDAGLRLRTSVVQATLSGNGAQHNANHGFLITGTTASVIEGNRLYANARPGGASTTGLLIGDSDGNRIERNLAYENQDSGFQVSDGADREPCLLAQRPLLGARAGGRRRGPGGHGERIRAGLLATRRPSGRPLTPSVRGAGRARAPSVPRSSPRR